MKRINGRPEVGKWYWADNLPDGSRQIVCVKMLPRAMPNGSYSVPCIEWVTQGGWWQGLSLANADDVHFYGPIPEPEWGVRYE